MNAADERSEELRCAGHGGVYMLEGYFRLGQSPHVSFQGIFHPQPLRIPRELPLSRGGKGRFQGEV